MKLFKNKKGASQGLVPMTLTIVVVIFFIYAIISFSVGFIGVENPNSTIVTTLSPLTNNLSSQMEYFTGTVCANSSGGNCTSDSLFQQLATSQPSPLQFVFLIAQIFFYLPLQLLTFVFSSVVMVGSLLILTTGGMYIMVVGVGLIVAGLLIRYIFSVISNIRSGQSGDH